MALLLALVCPFWPTVLRVLQIGILLFAGLRLVSCFLTLVLVVACLGLI